MASDTSAVGTFDPLNATGMGDTLAALPEESRRVVLRRGLMIGVIAFLTLIDLFGSQALLPTLVEVYGVTPAAMGFAVNASTIGMAAASLAVAVFARRINRARGIWVSLVLLSVPTALLSVTDDLATFTALRIAQGVFMSAAFTLTLTYLSEVCSLTAVGGAMAAYITGNVASNLFGRLLASGLADNIGLSESFIGFAILNLLGAVIAYRYFGSSSLLRAQNSKENGRVFAVWGAHMANPALRVAFVIGFILLFVFVGVFTYANFVIAGDPFKLPQMYIGLVYFVFIPAIFTTPVAATVTQRYGTRLTFLASMLATLAGLLLLVTPNLYLVLLGLAVVGAGLFFGQSVATAHVGRTAQHDHAAANGLYLASYYLGGICGALVVGQIFGRLGWTASVAFLAVLIIAAAGLSRTFSGQIAR